VILWRVIFFYKTDIKQLQAYKNLFCKKHRLPTQPQTIEIICDTMLNSEWIKLICFRNSFQLIYKSTCAHQMYFSVSWLIKTVRPHPLFVSVKIVYKYVLFSLCIFYYHKHKHKLHHKHNCDLNLQKCSKFLVETYGSTSNVITENIVHLIFHLSGLLPNHHCLKSHLEARFNYTS